MLLVLSFSKQTYLLYFGILLLYMLFFFINCTPTSLLDNKSPYKKLYTKSYDLTIIRVFGCLCYSSTIITNRKKFDARVVSAVFLGFQPNIKGYIFLNHKNHKIEVSRHVIFHEHQFRYKLNVDNNERPNNLSLPIPQNYAFTTGFIHDNHPSNTAHNTEKNIESVGNDTAHIHSCEPDEPVQEAQSLVPEEQSLVPEEQSNTLLRRLTCQRKTPMYLHDFHTSSIHTNHVSTKYPISNFLSYKSLSTDFKKIILSVSSHMEPQSYEEVSKYPC